MAGGAYIAMLRVGAFLLLIWGASRVSRLAGVSSIVLEITTGLVFSPGIIGLMPKEYAVCYYNLIDDCETQETLNHVQQKLGGCDYDAYMVKDGFSFASLPLAAVPAAGDHTAPAGTHDAAPSPATTGGMGTDSHGANATTQDHDSDSHGANPAPAPAANHSTDTDGTGTHVPAPASDHSTDTNGTDSDAAHNGTDTHGADSHSTPAPRRLSAFEEEDGEDKGTLFTAHNYGRRLAGGSNKGKTRYDNYEECLQKMCNLEVSHECTLTPNIFSFVGHIGVALMIFESGMHFDFEQAKTCAPIASAIAILGTFLPLVFGTVFVMLLCGKDLYPEGISAGTALAPTSVGIALKLLNEAKQLQKRHGQIIITAAFIDDILSLVLFNCLFAIGSGEISFMTFLPGILGILGMLGIVVFAGTKADEVVQWLLALAPKRPDRKLTPENELLFLMMMVLVLVLGTAFFFAGTHLWGCFMAGMCFAKLHFAHHVWVKQTKRVTSWMIRIFFSCTVAFSIPIDELLSLEAFWKGTIMGIGPCIATKVLCAAFAGETKWVIGWAMVGRAEFAYLIAQLAASSSMMSPEVFSVVIWSLLYATIFAPFLFRKVLASFVKKVAIREAGGQEAWENSGAKAEFEAEQSSGDFRQSGHLPCIDHDHQEDHEKEAKSKEISSASSVKSTNHKVASEYESEHRDTEVLVKKEGTYAAAPVAQQEMRPRQEEHADTANAAARGSGFLCCLFFRKIVIM